MKILKIAIATTFLIALVGCGETKTPSANETSAISTSTPQVANSSPSHSSTATSPSPSPNVPQDVEDSAVPKSEKAISLNITQPDKNHLIVPGERMGAAKVGMKLGELKKELAGKAQFQVKSPFIVDFDAIAIVESGKEQYYILYPAGVPMADTDIIEAIVTDNPKYRTAQGVGPGTPIKQAETIYGEANLSYNTSNESREYVKFANQPSDDIAFRTKAPSGEQFAGIYPPSQEELKETQKFEKAAAIGLVEIYCRQNCPLPSP